MADGRRDLVHIGFIEDASEIKYGQLLTSKGKAFVEAVLDTPMPADNVTCARLGCKTPATKHITLDGVLTMLCDRCYLTHYELKLYPNAYTARTLAKQRLREYERPPHD